MDTQRLKTDQGVYCVENRTLKIGEALEMFLAAKLTECAQRTVDTYHQRIMTLVDHLGHDHPLEAVKITDLRGWAVSLRKRDTRYQDHSVRPEINGGLSDTTRKGYVNAVRIFFRWLLEEGLNDANPAERLRMPRVTHNPKSGIDSEDLAAMVGAALTLRDRSLLLFFRDTGCRLGGVVSLTLARLQVDRGQADVIEKGSKVRTVFFLDECQAALSAWLGARPPADHDFVWLSEHPSHGYRRLEGNGVYRVFQRIAAAAGVTRNWNPHQWRHWRIHSWIEAGMPTSVAGQLAGHAPRGVTAKYYAQLPTQKLKKLHRKYSFKKT